MIGTKATADNIPISTAIPALQRRKATRPAIRRIAATASIRLSPIMVMATIASSAGTFRNDRTKLLMA